MTPPREEAWLRGPIGGVPARLMPVAHSLTDALEEFEAAASGLDVARLWQQPGGAASIGFHLRHVCGAMERLLTYARGEALTPEQHARRALEAEPGTPPATADQLLEDVSASVARTIDVLRATPETTLADPRRVGVAGLPSTVQGLLFHVAEHTRRHAGQVIVTAKVVRSPEPLPDATRAAWVATLAEAWEDAGVRGLCGDGRFEAAIGALRSLELGDAGRQD